MVGVTGGTRFYLGAHHANWLARVDVPLFVSHRRLAELGPGALPQARGPWALDSGAFSEIAEYGQFRTSPQQYADAVRRYADQVGRLEWAAPQDWMCEPVMLAKTGLTIAKHQRRTVANYLELRALAPEVPFIPVLQGWTTGDYLTCVDLYQAAGVDLAGVPVVGLGSVCRRQATAEIGDLVATLAGLGLRLHGFGVKRLGLARYGHLLASADSMAWSAQYRRQSSPLPGCAAHKNCANCLRAALRYRAAVLADLGQHDRLPQPARTASRATTKVVTFAGPDLFADAEAVLLAALEQVQTPTTASDQTGLSAVYALGRALAAITQRRVATARADGLSWGEVGRLLGMSRQAARQRFATTTDHEQRVGDQARRRAG